MRAEPAYNGPPARRRPAVPLQSPAAAAHPSPHGQFGPPPELPGPSAFQEQRTGIFRPARSIKKVVLEQLRKEGEHRTAPLSQEAKEQRGRSLINEQVAIWADGHGVAVGGLVDPALERELASLAFDMCFRAGRLQRYLDDEQVEDIWIEGFERVFLKYAGRPKAVQVERVADSEAELHELVRDLISASGHNRQFSTHSPQVELEMRDGSRLQAMGPEITDGRTHVTIRRHRYLDASLPKLVQLGTVTQEAADVLAAAVRGRFNVMVSGEAAAGKTTFLRALLKEIDREERFGTAETTFESLTSPAFHPHVVPMQERFTNGERGSGGRAAGEITLTDLIKAAKRMSLTRTIVGEVRGAEITAMMDVMTSERRGNMCTIHAADPSAVFDRVAELYLRAQENFSERLAYRQIANGVHFIAHLSVDDHGVRRLTHIWEVTGVTPDGRPGHNEIFGPSDGFTGPAVPRDRMSAPRMRQLTAAGLSADLLSAQAVSYLYGGPA
ncbi:CpaF/VirB11 family protein (plasmid) [Streptomyces sp. Q6]|uniref:CpaF/VirB11 family protein n=1 Tax=Streptomyces citrinus TaxID=3118173 RepID=A0ACD5AQS4_9ACTN